MKSKYIPPREDVILNNEEPEYLYLLKSGEVDKIKCDPAGKEQVYDVLHLNDMFGEVGVFCCQPQPCTYRTRTMTQLLQFHKSSLTKAVQAKMPDKNYILNNFL